MPRDSDPIIDEMIVEYTDHVVMGTAAQARAELMERSDLTYLQQEQLRQGMDDAEAAIWLILGGFQGRDSR